MKKHCNDCMYWGVPGTFGYADCKQIDVASRGDWFCADWTEKPEPTPSTPELVKAVNVIFDHVKDFHAAFNHPAPDGPVFFDTDDEEVFEFAGLLEYIANIMKRHPNRLVKRCGWKAEELSETLASNTPTGQVDGLCDLLYFVFGTFVEMGYRPGVAFDAVHLANMTKTPSRAGEKVTKPDGWEGPESAIGRDIQKQIYNAELSRESLCPNE